MKILKRILKRKFYPQKLSLEPYISSRRSWRSTCRRWDRATNWAIEGWILLVVQRETVISVTPIWAASHRLVFSFSASITRNLLRICHLPSSCLMIGTLIVVYLSQSMCKVKHKLLTLQQFPQLFF